MDRLVRELILLSQPMAHLSLDEARRALRLASAIGGKLVARRRSKRVHLSEYRSMIVAPANEAGLLTEAVRDYWQSSAASLDSRFVAFEWSYALAKATR